MKFIIVALTVLGSFTAAGPFTASAMQPGQDSPLFQAAKNSDAAAVARLIEEGEDVNAVDRYGAAPLAFAADRGNVEIVKLLVDAGAEVNHTDEFYGGNALYWAAYHGHGDVLRYLIEHEADNVASALQTVAMRGHLEGVKAIVEAKEIAPASIAMARRTADQAGHAEISKFLAALEPATESSDSRGLQSFAGKYGDGGGTEFDLVVKDGALGIQATPEQVVFLERGEESTFRMGETTVKFEWNEQQQVTALVIVAGDTETRMERVSDPEPPEEERPEPLVAPPSLPAWTPSLDDLSVSSANWPQFRGTGARGLADGQNPPVRFDVPSGRNVAWKTPVAGLGHSCPVIWDDMVFVTTAVSADDNRSLRTGVYGDFDSVEDDSTHRWQVWCLDKPTGQVRWVRTAHQGAPLYKRHLKSTHANSSPATDGNYIVAFFGSEGLHCYTMDGEHVWSKYLGPLNSGWFYDEAYQWGFGSSPVIHNSMVFVQCDIQEGSFVAALDLATGNEKWRAPREEIPSWGTPTIHESPTGSVVLTAASKFARAYDATNGTELWRLGGHSEIPVPTPFVAHNLVYITSGYRPIRPIYAVRLDAAGDITPPNGITESEFIAWSQERDGPYMPTPLVYGDYLYVCNNSGLFSCYDAKTGERVYRQRLTRDGARSFVGSLVAGDGRIYVASEEGNVLVIQAGPTFRLLGFNALGEACHATPAISQGLMIIRTAGHVMAVGNAGN